MERVKEISERLNFLHWELAFPKVFSGENPGFDCVLGNPPWERIKLQEEEFFAQRDPEIAKALNKSVRKKMIDALQNNNPVLANAFEVAKHDSESVSKFIRNSGKFPLTGVGDVNTYALFSELSRNAISPVGKLGIIVPIGIVTDETTKFFFDAVIQSQTLEKVVGFENESFIFREIHHSTKFCCLTITGSDLRSVNADFVFFCRSINQINDKLRHFQFSQKDISLINPNSKTCPIFRTVYDANLTKQIYQKSSVLVNDAADVNPWSLKFLRMIDMANDSGDFLTQSKDKSVPLYEAKMMDHFDHRYGTYEGATQAHLNLGNLPQTTNEQKQNPAFGILPRYWIDFEIVRERLHEWEKNWLLAFRDVTSSISERTSIFSILPIAGVGHTAPLVIFQGKNTTREISCFLGNVNSLIFDYIARQKVPGLHLTFTILKQLPVLPPSAYAPADIDFIAPRVLELVYTAHDLRPFAEDMGYHGEPFRWDDPPGRRAQIRAELDAYYARLYGLTRDELRYILDPKEVHGEDFPGETFRVLKEKEIRLYGEFRTRRLVLAMWDRLARK